MLTLLGVILGVLLEQYFYRKEMREKLFKALFEEIKLNHSVAKGIREKYKSPDWTIFELSPLYTLSYQNIRTTGELSILSRDTLRLLEETYEMIYAHNRQTTVILSDASGFIRDRGLKERIEKIEKNLEQLEQNLLNELCFLKDAT